MESHFEAKKPTAGGSAAKDQTAVDSISYKAKLVNSATAGTWPSNSLLQQQQQAQPPRNLSFGPSGMSFPDPRRGSLGSFGGGGGGDLSFPDSRRSSLAFGLDFDVGEEQQLSTDSISALTSHSHTMASRSLLNASLGQSAQSANAQLLLGPTSGGEGLTIQQRQLLLQHQHHQLQQQQQQQQSLSAINRSSDASRIQAEAQAAAAALFFGAPLPSSDNSPTNGLGLGGLGQPGQLGSNTGQFSEAGGSRNFLGSSVGLPSPLSAPCPLPSTLQDLNPNIDLKTNTGNGGGSLPALDTSNLNPLNSFSQLQQLQQQRQQQLQRLQSSFGALGGDQNRIQQPPPSQQLQEQQQQQLQQVQLQQQLQRQQQQIRRHSLSMGFPFDVASTSARSQQPEQTQRGLGLSISEQLRWHQEQLDKLQSRGDILSSDGKMSSISSQQPPAKKRGKAGSKDTPSGANVSSKAGANKKDASFPLKLHEILSNAEYEDMVAWLPHGKSWRILKPNDFENIVIPLHFRHSKYASFMRQVSSRLAGLIKC